jgi:hypothetical protein
VAALPEVAVRPCTLRCGVPTLTVHGCRPQLANPTCQSDHDVEAYAMVVYHATREEEIEHRRADIKRRVGRGPSKRNVRNTEEQELGDEV